METDTDFIKFVKTERSSFNEFQVPKNTKLSINEATNNVVPDDVFKFNRFIIQNSHRSSDRHKSLRDSKTPLFIQTMSNRPFVDSSLANIRPMTAKSRKEQRYNNSEKKKKKGKNTMSMKQLTQTS